MNMPLLIKVLTLLLAWIALSECVTSKPTQKNDLPTVALPPFIKLEHIGMQDKGITPVVLGISGYKYPGQFYVQFIHKSEYEMLSSYLSEANPLLNKVVPQNVDWGSFVIVMNRASHEDLLFTNSSVDSKKLFQSMLERITDPGEEENDARYALETLIHSL